jgi:lipooligosaccharide transport system permease protein
MARAWRIVQRNALVYRRVWRGTLFFSFLQPMLFLLSIGVGLGKMVDTGNGALPAGVPFLAFLAPGLLAASCMQTASFEAGFPIIDKMTWHRNYEAITATPIRIRDLVIGELMWAGFRLLTIAAAFTCVLWLMGAARGPMVILAVPAAVLTGLAFSAPIMGYAATLKHPNRITAVMRFGITPLFLFSGVFFPITRLPRGLQAVAPLTPLYHGVELTRGLTLNTLTSASAAIHVSYLCAVVIGGVLYGIRTFTRRLHA